MVVCSGRSQRHVGATADHLIEDLKARGVGDVRVEGMPHCDWVLIDAGDVIVHIFRPEVRFFLQSREDVVGRTARRTKLVDGRVRPCGASSCAWVG